MPQLRAPASFALTVALLTFGLPIPSIAAGEFTVQPLAKTEMKAVFGKVESSDIVTARARLGGTIISLQVEEGAAVKAGDLVAVVADDKLALQLGAIDASLKALDSQMQNAMAELQRGKKLFATGVAAKSRVDALQTLYDVLVSQITATQAQRAVLVEQGREGQVMAPAPGRVLSVPVTKGSVVMPGETVARIAGGQYFLRLSLPERHAAHIHEGDDVLVGGRGISSEVSDVKLARRGKLVKVYPEIVGGNVQADVEVDGLGNFFVGERTLVWIPVGQRQVLGVPSAAISNQSGVDIVRLVSVPEPIDVAVIVGEAFQSSQGTLTEILTGLGAGDRVVVP